MRNISLFHLELFSLQKLKELRCAGWDDGQKVFEVAALDFVCFERSPFCKGNINMVSLPDCFSVRTLPFSVYIHFGGNLLPVHA